MNKTRRKALNALQDRLTSVKDLIQEHVAELQDIYEALEALRDEEQEGFDNLSEGLQEAERGQAMQEAANQMDEALGAIDNIKSAIEDDSFDEAFNAIEEAKGEA